MLKKEELKQLIDDTLKAYNLYSVEASDLVYGTIAQESRLGHYRRQNVPLWLYNRHALGISQIEKNTFDWLQKVYVGRFPEIAKVQFIDLAYNDRMAILFCRLRYLIDSDPIPTDLEGQANYWKRIYNTKMGKGTPEEYIKNYKKYS